MSALLFIAAWATEPDWNATLERVLPSVLVVEMDRTRPFDGNAQASTEASGFVVDAERGLVLTNRHVVTTGPTRARGIFPNREEVVLEPVYVDPVHDFGFFRYDPAEVEHSSPASLELAPEGARIGRDIRVIGNDAAEQLSILAGTLSRVDREAPWWDFDTFYLQAASSTSGGSSGSPVFDVDGRVVALNAGARSDAATSLFLPLDRVVVALEALQRGETPPRGTLQAVFAYTPYDELRRLGLPDAVEDAVRARWDGTGLLVVGRVNPGGPAETAGLLEGDVLLALDGTPVHDFPALEAALDGAVGGTLRLTVSRAGRTLDVAVPVQDLHDLIPARYLEIGEGLLHPLGYPTAVRVPRPVQGVMVGRAGRILAPAGIGTDALITGIGATEVRTLDDAIGALQQVPDGERVQIRWQDLDDPTSRHLASVLVERSFWPVRVCARDGGDWPCEELPAPVRSEAAQPRPVDFPAVDGRRLQSVADALVEVSAQPLLNLDSAHGDRRISPGLLLDADGLVLTDRNAIPVSATQVRVRIGDAPSIPAEVVAMDPVHNVAFVRADLSRVRLARPVQPPTFVDEPLAVGTRHTLVGRGANGLPVTQSVTVERVEHAAFGTPAKPRFQERDVDVYRIGTLDRPVIGGVLVDRKGRVTGLLQPFPSDAGGRHAHGLNVVDPRQVLASLERLQAGGRTVPTLGLDLWPRPLSEAVEAGLDDGVAARLRALRPEQPEILEVARISGEAPAARLLEVGDWLVEVDGRPVARLHAVEDAVQAGGTVPVTVIRNGARLQLQVPTLPLSVEGTTRAVLWAGSLVQEEPPEVAFFGRTPARGVYLSWFYGGSPAQRHGTGYGRRLLSIDGEEVRDLDHFLELVGRQQDGQSVRLVLADLRGESWVVTLELDHRFWPTELFEHTEGGWIRRPLDSDPG